MANKRPNTRTILARILLTSVMIWFMVCFALIMTIHQTGKIETAEPSDAIVVLGAGLSRNGRPGWALTRRSSHAADLWHQGLADTIICNPGKLFPPLVFKIIERRDAEETAEVAARNVQLGGELEIVRDQVAGGRRVGLGVEHAKDDRAVRPVVDVGQCAFRIAGPAAERRRQNGDLRLRVAHVGAFDDEGHPVDNPNLEGLEQGLQRALPDGAISGPGRQRQLGPEPRHVGDLGLDGAGHDGRRSPILV